MKLIDHQNEFVKIERHLHHLLKPKGIDRFVGLEEAAIQLCCALMLRYFRESGICIQESKTISCDNLNEHLNVKAPFQKMISLFLRILSKEQFIMIGGDNISFLKKAIDCPSPDVLQKKIQEMHPKFNQFFSFVDHCSKHYPQVFSGAKSGLDAIFPNGDSSLLSKTYQNTPKIGYEQLYLTLTRELMIRICDYKNERSINDHFSHKMLPTVLEIGSGQGILTDILMPALSEKISQYHFTDIGQTFVNEGKKKYNYVPQDLMKFAVLDATLNPKDQGFEHNTFDFLVGFNVLHATKDISKTIANAATLLKNNGIMFIIENVKQQIWIDMIYGLTAGWWEFDDGIRKTSPLLSKIQWKNILQQSGFQHFFIFPDENDLISDTDSSLILLQK